MSEHLIPNSTLPAPSLGSAPLAVAGLALLCMLTLVACGGGAMGDVNAEPGTVSLAPPSETGTSSAVIPAPGAGSLTALSADNTCGLPEFRDDLLQRINAARAVARTCGTNAMAATTPLNWDARLFSAAAGHSTDMAVNNYFSHTGLDGRSASKRISDAGYVWSSAGENIAAGQSTAAAVMNGWLASAGHCANIMETSYQDVAVSCVQRSDSSYGRYWTMSLARPKA